MSTIKINFFLLQIRRNILETINVMFVLMLINMINHRPIYFIHFVYMLEFFAD